MRRCQVALLKKHAAQNCNRINLEPQPNLPLFTKTGNPTALMINDLGLGLLPKHADPDQEAEAVSVVDHGELTQCCLFKYCNLQLEVVVRVQ
jgi:hypothetical protein